MNSAKLIVLRPGTIWLHFTPLKNFLTEMTPVWNFTESDNWINVLNFASRILAISVVNYTCRPCMGSTKKIVENIPVEISMGGRNTDFHTRGCSLPILPSFQWTILSLAILETFAQFVTSYPWASLPFFFTSLTFWLFEHFCSCCCNENPCYFCAFCEICGLLEGLFTFRLWYSCYICSRCFILSNEKFSFAIFAKSVDFWEAFFTSVLNKYELFQNLLFLILIRYLLKRFSFCK